MSDTVAARVDEDTKQWLDNRAEQKDVTVSSLVSEILESQSGDGTEPESTEARLNEIEKRLDMVTVHTNHLGSRTEQFVKHSNHVWVENFSRPPLPELYRSQDSE